MMAATDIMGFSFFIIFPNVEGHDRTQYRINDDTITKRNIIPIRTPATKQKISE